ncbi:hypothetical protein ALI144C_40890 [Actinosynnema sp. ALI-1.44]|uniref:heavy metal-binding domain-containing protein n=1 Tax=Actinosynnema sp. ALI-1.44 TaxID=1933779 RepID=UPI00097BF80B|nr:heavy metal-binding domain-containing protein [Actinosynnema sp. ALI-1.44]ONI75111.1 hypothetical protein ALI144C_40890 [Actinosynnema sp. ALI-1.44]
MTEGAYTSNITVAEHHALRAVGFAPVGLVMGNYVFNLRDTTTSGTCGYTQPDAGDRLFRPASVVAPVVRAAPEMRVAAHDAHERAVNHMRQECRALGGDGVVAVELTTRPFPFGGTEFLAVGTAVRATGAVRSPEPFLSDLSGQDFAKLIEAGWVPCGLVIGLAVVLRHDDSNPLIPRRWRDNAEIRGYTELAQAARTAARDQIRHEVVRLGGAGVVARAVSLKLSLQLCRMPQRAGHDRLAEAIVVGTAITPFRHGGPGTPPLPVMRLR